MARPDNMLGLHHVALNVVQLEECERFYVTILGMQVEWRPDADNVYLSSGSDNLALHRVAEVASARPALDHIGFVINAPDAVDQWYAFLQSHQVPIRAAPQTHRDGARSFYCTDPAGNTVQLIYHPSLAIPPGQG